MASGKLRIICSSCGKEKDATRDFYKSFSPFHKSTGHMPICKSCLAGSVKEDDIKSFTNMLRAVDKPFISHLYESAKQSNAFVGEYFKLVNAKDFRYLTWDDSDFNSDKSIPKNSNQHETVLQQGTTQQPINYEEIEELKEIYGEGYPDEEYILFEKKFRKLKPSFQLPTTMHEEYLREYCVNKVKETLAKSKGDFKEAKEWSIMAKEAADAGKLKPSQMSKADLSNGLDGFGQLSRMVEQHRDIIPLLPKFTQQPKDKVDITLWLYINYIRDLEGLPPAEYNDIYNFYEERRKDYEAQELDSSPEMQVTNEDE